MAPIQKLSVQNKDLNAEESPYPHVFHQNETRGGLPEGAIVRLGKGGINTMQFSPDGTRFAVGSDVGLWVYDVATGAEVDLSNNIIGQVNTIAFSPDSRLIACGGYFRPIIQMWDMETGTELPQIQLPTSITLNMDIPIKSVIELAFSKNGDNVDQCKPYR